MLAKHYCARMLKCASAVILVFTFASCVPIGAPKRPAVGYLDGDVLVVVVPKCIEPRNYVEVSEFSGGADWAGTTKDPLGERQLHLDGKHFATDDPSVDVSKSLEIYITSNDDDGQDGVFTMYWIPEEYPAIRPGEAYDFARERTVKISEYMNDESSCDPL